MNDNDLVFLVQMNGGSTAGRDKSVINAHVSKQTHSRRRRERILQAQRTQDLSSAYAQVPERIRTSFSSEDANPQNVVDHLSPTWRQIVGFDSPRTSPSSPNPLDGLDPLKGLDAKAEDYLRFGREVLEPAIHSVGYRGWVALTAPREEYVGPDLLTGSILADGHPHASRADCFRVFVFAILAYCASGVAAIGQVQHAHHDALNYTTRCMKSLREYLDNLNQNIDNISEDLVYRLFRAEVLASNYSSASAHGRLLKKIFEYKSQSGPIRLDILSNTIYQDNQRAFSSWSRPIFDQAWIRQQYQGEWQQAGAIFDGKLEEEARRLSRCVRDPQLLPYLVAVKRLMLQTQSLAKRSLSATPSNFFWFATQCEWLQSCLMTYYLDRDQRAPDASEKTTAGSTMNLHLCVSLATLCVLRHSKNDVHIRGQPLFQGCKNIYLHLDARLSILARAMNREDSEQNLEAIVFILFVAAVAEYHHFTFNERPNTGYAWRRRLGQYLVANDVTSWETMSHVLSRFPYSELEMPTPYATWFQEIVSETEPG